MSANSIELLIKAVVWRAFSMLFGTWVAYMFTGDILKSSLVVLVSGISLMFLHWLFELIWDNYAREQIRGVISGKTKLS